MSIPIENAGGACGQSYTFYMTFETQAGHPDTVNVLLVDDQPANRSKYRSALRDGGEHLILVRSAQAAMDKLSECAVAVVLINVGLRGSNALELCRTIRQHPRCQATSILLVSDTPITGSDHLEGYRSGATDYLSLPVNPEVLRAKVTLLAGLYRNVCQVEKLRKSDQRKNHFLAALAHELRNPLAPIASAAHVLRMKAPQDKDSEWVSEVIERQVGSLKKLIDDLLDISRISQNQLVIQREKIELGSILAAAAQAARPAIKKYGHEVSVRLPKEPIWVFADRVRLTEAFENLLDNSAESTNPGRCISLVADLEDAGVAVRITSDVGSQGGESVGEPFHQVDNAVAEPQGLGVGLSLVWELVEMHGGSVEVSSRGSGIGREYTVHLPVMAELPVDSDPALSQPVSSLRVLIAEDNPDAAATLAMSLRLEGHQVEIAHDGTEALNIAETFRPQVALLDIAMPRISGYELAEKIRGRAWGKEALLIAQTGWGRAQDWEKAIVSGFNFHLTKPLNYDALTKILDNFSNHSSATAMPDNKSNAA